MVRLLALLACAAVGAAHPAYDLAADGDGRVYFLDWPKKRLLRVSAEGAVATVADLSAVARGTDPHTFALDADGGVLVGASYTDKVWKVRQGVVTAVDLAAYRVGGAHVLNLSRAGGRWYLLLHDKERKRFRLVTEGGRVLLDVPRDTLDLYSGSFCVGADGTVFLAANNRIWKLAAGGKPTVFAGAAKAGLADGRGAAARFDEPYGLCLDDKGRLLVADHGNGRVRAIDGDGMVTTLPGRFPGVHALCRGREGRIHVAEYGRAVIRIRTIHGKRVATLATVETR